MLLIDKKIFLFQLICVTWNSKFSDAQLSAAYFQEASNQQNDLYYIIVDLPNLEQGGFNPGIHCGIECLGRTTCNTFYREDGACILGVDEISDREQNDVIEPRENQAMMAKGNAQYYVFIYMLIFTVYINVSSF